jgi:hypothetical protein
MVIWKQAITAFGTHSMTFQAPRGSKFLSCQLQHNEVVLWYACNPEALMLWHEVAAVVTGGSIPRGMKLEHYISTIQFDGGSYVKHWFVRELY